MNTEAAIKSKIDQARPFDELVKILLEFKKNGGSQQEAIAFLEHLLSEYRQAELEEREEVVMDLLDRATGFTHDSKKIW